MSFFNSFAAHSSLSHWLVVFQPLFYLSFCLWCDLLGGQRNHERYCGQWHGGLRNSVIGYVMREILPWPERCSFGGFFYNSSKVLCVLQCAKSLVLEVRYGVKILNLSCKKCHKIYIRKILGVYTFDIVSQSAQYFLQ